MNEMKGMCMNIRRKTTCVTGNKIITEQQQLPNEKKKNKKKSTRPYLTPFFVENKFSTI